MAVAVFNTMMKAGAFSGEGVTLVVNLVVQARELAHQEAHVRLAEAQMLATQPAKPPRFDN